MAPVDKPTVLVADDRELTEILLEQYCGCRVLEAEDGAEAVEVARSERPDLILMDLRMPGLDGYEAAARIREDPALQSVPMIAYTAYYSFSITNGALEAGFDEYTRKPMTAEEMSELVGCYLKAR